MRDICLCRLKQRAWSRLRSHLYSQMNVQCYEEHFLFCFPFLNVLISRFWKYGDAELYKHLKATLIISPNWIPTNPAEKLRIIHQSSGAGVQIAVWNCFFVLVWFSLVFCFSSLKQKGKGGKFIYKKTLISIYGEYEFYLKKKTQNNRKTYMHRQVKTVLVLHHEEIVKNNFQLCSEIVIGPPFQISLNTFFLLFRNCTRL